MVQHITQNVMIDELVDMLNSLKNRGILDDSHFAGVRSDRQFFNTVLKTRMLTPYVHITEETRFKRGQEYFKALINMRTNSGGTFFIGSDFGSTHAKFITAIQSRRV